MDWRRKYRVDLLNDGYQSPDVLTKYFAAGHLGVDKFKSNLLLIRYGMIDIKGVLLSSKKKDYVMHVVQIVEKTLAMFRKDPMKYKRSPDAISQASVIVDLEGFSMNHVTFKPGIVFHNITIKFVQTNNLLVYFSPISVRFRSAGYGHSVGPDVRSQLSRIAPACFYNQCAQDFFNSLFHCATFYARTNEE